MLSGSVALGFHAVARTTRDIDIVIQLNPTDIDKLVSDFPGFYFSRITIEEEVKRNGMFNLIDTQSGYKIDFILVKNSEYGLEAFQRREKKESNGFYIWVISKEDLILAKLIWIQEYESDRQISDIRSLLSNPATDLSYLHFWIKKLQLKTYRLF